MTNIAEKNLKITASQHLNLDQFVEACQNIIGKDNCDKWLNNISLYAQTESEIIIQTPSKLNRDWINREFFSSKNFIRSIKDYYPKILKISAIYLPNQEIANEVVKDLAPIKSGNQNIVNLSKHDNLFAYGTELNTKYTFDNFIECAHNKIALSMAKIVAGLTSQNSLFDDKIPLFIHGNVGMGKTHLAQAIAWHIKNHNKNKKVVYMSAEKFMFHFVQSIRNNDIMLFKEKMRSIDVLIVDDVQFIAGKDATQQEFMNCFNSLVEENKQVVLVCDRCPTALENIDEKLKSRISGGMIVNFKNPNFSDRLAFVQQKAQQINFEINADVLNHIANNIKGSNRDLEGALKKLFAEKLFGENEISISSSNVILANYFKSTNIAITIENIQKIIADFYNINVKDLTDQNRNKKIVIARQIAMYLSKKNCNLSLKAIGEKFNKNHATIIHAINAVEQQLNCHSKISEEVRLIAEKHHLIA